jgi:glucose-6-phosphate 1-dehydrogenase
VQNLIAMRLTGSVLEAVWNSTHVEQVEILWRRHSRSKAARAITTKQAR